MSELKIKSTFKGRFVAFKGANGKRLGELSQDQLKTLAALAKASNDKSLLDLFDTEVPDLTKLQKEKVDKEISKLSKP